jgi:hypothetical protein
VLRGRKSGYASVGMTKGGVALSVESGSWLRGNADPSRPPKNPHRTTEPIRLPRIQDQVHVVWHQAVSPHFHVRLFKENRLSTIATLRHVVRETGYHHAGQMRHPRKLNANLN